MNDTINHPSHYADQGVMLEPIELTSRLPHPLASAYEYAIRAGKKEGSPELVDLKKARFWLDFYINHCLWWDDTRSLMTSQNVLLLLRMFARQHTIARLMVEALEQEPMAVDVIDHVPANERVAQAMLAYVEARISKLEGADHEKA